MPLKGIRGAVGDWDNTARNLVPDEEEIIRLYAKVFAPYTNREPNLVRQGLKLRVYPIMRQHTADPQRGWTDQYGRVLIPPADILVSIRIAARSLLDEYGLFEDKEEREALLERVYQAAFRATPVTFRRGTAEFFLGLKDLGMPATIVSNSGTEHIREQLDHLGEQSGSIDTFRFVGVEGQARKYVLGPYPPNGQNEMRVTIPGMSYPMETDRPQYEQVLQTFLDKHGLRWDELLVIGDIPQMDLGMPHRKGATVLIVATARTPRVEISFWQDQPRAHIVRDLRHALRVIQHLKGQAA